MSQILINGVFAAAEMLLFATGLAIIYRVAGFLNFAQGAVFAACAYVLFALTAWVGLALWVSVILAVTSTIFLGILLEFAVYRPLRRRGASSLVLLLASLGLYIILQNFISILFGDDTKSIRAGIVGEGMDLWGGRVTSVQLLTICVSALLTAGVAILLKRTNIGKAIRAVANAPDLAAVAGVDDDRVVLSAFAISSALAGVAGVLMAFDVDMTPTMGMNALMTGVVVVVIGGSGHIPGLALGAVLLGLAQHLGIWRIGSEWQDAIAFIVLLAFLLVKPQGFGGRKPKKATA